MEVFAKLLRIEFHSLVEFEDTKAFNIATEKMLILQKKRGASNRV